MAARSVHSYSSWRKAPATAVTVGPAPAVSARRNAGGAARDAAGVFGLGSAALQAGRGQNALTLGATGFEPLEVFLIGVRLAGRGAGCHQRCSHQDSEEE